MPVSSSFDYAIVRVVPHVEREEFINVGVILFCRTLRFLGARIELDAERLAALSTHIDIVTVQAHLDLIPRVCAGGSASTGWSRRAALLFRSRRFTPACAPTRRPRLTTYLRRWYAPEGRHYHE
jgi:hypothetical protein